MLHRKLTNIVCPTIVLKEEVSKPDRTWKVPNKESRDRIVEVLGKGKTDWAFDQAEAILAPLCKEPSAEKTMQNLKDSISKPGVKLAYNLICLMPRSDFIKQAEDPSRSGILPGMLAIAKKINKIDYMDWKPEHNEHFVRLCGYSFRNLLHYVGKHEKIFTQYSEAELLDLKDQSEGRSTFDISRTDNAEFNKLDQDFRRLLLRKWLWATPGKYGVNNLDNWDDQSSFHFGITLHSLKEDISGDDIFGNEGPEDRTQDDEADIT